MCVLLGSDIGVEGIVYIVIWLEDVDERAVCGSW